MTFNNVDFPLPLAPMTAMLLSRMPASGSRLVLLERALRIPSGRKNGTWLMARNVVVSVALKVHMSVRPPR